MGISEIYILVFSKTGIRRVATRTRKKVHEFNDSKAIMPEISKEESSNLTIGKTFDQKFKIGLGKNLKNRKWPNIRIYHW